MCSLLTCHPQATLRGVCDRWGDSHRRVPSLLQHTALTQGLGFFQFTPPSLVALPLCSSLFPFVGRLRLEAPSVVDASAVALAAGFAVVRVPGKATLHEWSLFCIGAHLEGKSQQTHQWACKSDRFKKPVHEQPQGEEMHSCYSDYCLFALKM